MLSNHYSVPRTSITYLPTLLHSSHHYQPIHRPTRPLHPPLGPNTIFTTRSNANAGHNHTHTNPESQRWMTHFDFSISHAPLGCPVFKAVGSACFSGHTPRWLWVGVSQSGYRFCEFGWSWGFIVLFITILLGSSFSSSS
jgi:hypothetical protein